MRDLNDAPRGRRRPAAREERGCRTRRKGYAALLVQDRRRRLPRTMRAPQHQRSLRSRRQRRGRAPPSSRRFTVNGRPAMASVIATEMALDAPPRARIRLRPHGREQRSSTGRAAAATGAARSSPRVEDVRARTIGPLSKRLCARSIQRRVRRASRTLRMRRCWYGSCCNAAGGGARATRGCGAAARLLAAAVMRRVDASALDSAASVAARARDAVSRATFRPSLFGFIAASGVALPTDAMRNCSAPDVPRAADGAPQSAPAVQSRLQSQR